MNIIILHRIPYYKINYHLSIDHDEHEVTYIGLATHLVNLPSHIRCQQIIRQGLGNWDEELIRLIAAHALTPDLLIALSESEMLGAARLREHLGIPGATVSEVLKLQDKSLLKQLVSQAGIRVPRKIPLHKLIKDMRAPWQGSTLLRPVEQRPSRDLKAFASTDQLLRAIKTCSTGIAGLDDETKRADQLARFEIEELIEGKVMHFDGLVSANRIAVVVGSVYVGNFTAYAAGQPLGSVQADLSGADQLWIQGVMDAIGMRHGMFHVEAIATDCGKVFLDFANRAGGANTIETFKMATGINLISAELSSQLGEQVTAKVRRKPRKFGWFVFPGHHLPDGQCSIIGHANYVDHPMMLRCEMLNQRMPLPRDVTFHPALVPMSGIFCGSSTEEMISWIKKMFRDVEIRPREKSRLCS